MSLTGTSIKKYISRVPEESIMCQSDQEPGWDNQKKGPLIQFAAYCYFFFWFSSMGFRWTAGFWFHSYIGSSQVFAALSQHGSHCYSPTPFIEGNTSHYYKRFKLYLNIEYLQPSLVTRSTSIADVVLRLKALREDKYLQDLMDVHGILEVKKIVNLYSLKPILGHEGTTTYGFKATKRKFKIEVCFTYKLFKCWLITNFISQKLHLPPSLEAEKSSLAELGEASVGCGSSGSSKSKLDFWLMIIG